MAEQSQNNAAMEVTLGQALLSLLPSILGGLGGGGAQASQEQLYALQQAIDSFEAEMRSKTNTAILLGGVALFIAFIALLLAIIKKK